MNYNNLIVKEDLKNIIESVNDIEKLANSSILITGANGMLAKYLVYTCMFLNETKNYNIKVIGLVRNKQKALKVFNDFVDNSNFELLVQDVCDPIEYDKPIDYIIHAAGGASPNNIINNPFDIIKSNTLGTFNVLKLASEKDCKNVLYLSTREIYGTIPNDTEYIDENMMGIMDPLDYRNCYPESKRLGENLFKVYQTKYNNPMNIVRIAHAYGPGMEIDNDGRVMADMIASAVYHRDIVFNSDGTAVRAFCYITDAITGIFTVLINGQNGQAYNIANELEPVPIKEVANLIKKSFPERVKNIVYNVDNSYKKHGYSNIKATKLNTKKLEELGWYPKVPLVEGIKRTILSFDK